MKRTSLEQRQDYWLPCLSRTQFPPRLSCLPGCAHCRQTGGRVVVWGKQLINLLSRIKARWAKWSSRVTDLRTSTTIKSGITVTLVPQRQPCSRSLPTSSSQARRFSHSSLQSLGVHPWQFMGALWAKGAQDSLCYSLTASPSLTETSSALVLWGLSYINIPRKYINASALVHFPQIFFSPAAVLTVLTGNQAFHSGSLFCWREMGTRCSWGREGEGSNSLLRISGCLFMDAHTNLCRKLETNLFLRCNWRG